MSLNPEAIGALASRLQSAEPDEILAAAFRASARPALAFSGAEDVLLLHFAARAGLKPDVFAIDTGRLHSETLAFFDAVRERYGLPIRIVAPQAPAVEALVSAKGHFSFYREGHQECCSVRKVEPLRRALGSAEAWITGQRRDQNPSTRGALAPVEADSSTLPGRTLAKFNPLAAWSAERVWETIRALEVPFNPLHLRGFRSIGCEPCTRPVLPGQHEREGRWWWENAAHRECGLHAANLKSEGGKPHAV